MGLLIIFLSFVIVLDCCLLTLLVLIQLPKKEAGAGQAFGGGATDALFGAGSGNVLTKLTKYAAGVFLGVAMVLAVLISRQDRLKREGVGEELKKVASTPISMPAAPTNMAGLVTPAGTNKTITLSSTTNATVNLGATSNSPATVTIPPLSAPETATPAPAPPTPAKTEPPK